MEFWRKLKTKSLVYHQIKNHVYFFGIDNLDISNMTDEFKMFNLFTIHMTCIDITLFKRYLSQFKKKHFLDQTHILQTILYTFNRAIQIRVKCFLDHLKRMS